MDNQLIKLIDDNGLDKTKSQVLLDNFSGYFEMAAEWERKASELVIIDISQKDEMKLAREGRLFLKDKRIAVEKTRKQLKEASLREGQTIDAIAKVLTNLITPIEKDLEEKEKFAEIQEAKRIETLKDARTRELEPYIEFVPYGLNLGTMDEDNYSKVLSGAKLQKQAKEEAERKAEQERIAFEKLVKQRKEREIELLNIDGVKSNPNNTFTLTDEENPDFSNVIDFKDILDCDDDKFKSYKDEFLATAESNKAYREKLKAEKERLQKEAEERERQLAEERAKAEAERKAIEEKARKEREEHERILLIEREKQSKLEAERRAEQARIEAERLEAERKAAAEKRTKEEADRRAKNAPDKEKLLVFATELEKLLYNAPDLKADDAIAIFSHINPIMKDTITYIRLNSDKL